MGSDRDAFSAVLRPGDLEQDGHVGQRPLAPHLLGLRQSVRMGVAGEQDRAHRRLPAQRGRARHPGARVRGDAVLGADPGLAVAEDDGHVRAVAARGRTQAGGGLAVAQDGQARMAAQQRGGRGGPHRPLQGRMERLGLLGPGHDEQQLARGQQRAQPDRQRLARHALALRRSRPRPPRSVDGSSATRRTSSPGREPGSLKATCASRPSPRTARSTGAVSSTAW